MKSLFVSGGVRGLLLLLAGMLLAGTVSCGGGGGAVRESEGAGGTKGKNIPSAPTVAVVYANGYQITVQGKNMHSVQLEFASGLNEVYQLSRQGTCFSANRETLEAIRVMNKGGDYWYFDGAGFPISDEDEERRTSGLLGNVVGGTLGLVTKVVKPAPVIKIRCTGGPYDKTASGAVGNGRGLGKGKKVSSLGDVIVNVTSNELFSEVKVGTSTDAVLTFSTEATTSGSFDTEDTVTVEAVQVTLAADGSKWYFDAAGNVLPLDSKWYTDLD